MTYSAETKDVLSRLTLRTGLGAALGYSDVTIREWARTGRFQAEPVARIGGHDLFDIEAVRAAALAVGITPRWCP